MQIINGAQTVSSLANQPPLKEVEVLFRLTQSEDYKTEKGFNRQIIQFNNSQNQIKVSDFRSNDPIQLFLEKQFKDRKARGPLPKIKYVRKRAVGRRGTGTGIKLEEMAKIRYAFLEEPTLIHSAPKSLWTHAESGGAYERAFGVDGKIENLWSEDTFGELLLALAFYLRISDDCKRTAKETPELRFLRRLRFHALALAGVYARKEIEPSSILHVVTSTPNFDGHWSAFWPTAKDVLVDSFTTSTEDEDMSTFAYVRSAEKYANMERRVLRRWAAAK